MARALIRPEDAEQSVTVVSEGMPGLRRHNNDVALASGYLSLSDCEYAASCGYEDRGGVRMTVLDTDRSKNHRRARRGVYCCCSSRDIPERWGAVARPL